MRRVIDVHNHLFSGEWLEYLEKRTESPRLERGEVITLYSHEAVTTHIVNRGHYDPAARVRDLDDAGIDTQIVSMTIPGVEELPPDDGVTWARKINDFYAEVSQKYPGRFYAYATLPCQEVNEAVKEIDRAYRDLGVKGLSMFSNVNFKPLCSPEFFPIYAKAEAYGLPVFIHPALPFTAEIMKRHRLPAGVYGFTLDTTLAVMSLISNGVLERYPKLKIVHAHLGGVVPYLARRMDASSRASSRELGIDLPKPPSEYYKEQVYPDSISGHMPALRCCLDFVGAEHICLGTDYPHRTSNWKQDVALLNEMGLSNDDIDNVLGGNAARIFQLN